MNDRNRLSQLQKQYRRAWNYLIVEVESLQSLVHAGNAENDGVVEQRVRVDMAAASYRNARNELAQCLLDCGVAAEDHLDPVSVHNA